MLKAPTCVEVNAWNCVEFSAAIWLELNLATCAVVSDCRSSVAKLPTVVVLRPWICVVVNA